MTPRRLRLVASIGLAIALLVGGYALIGVLMAGSATMNASRAAEASRVEAWIYLSLMSASIAGAVLSIAFLMRSRGSARPPA